AKSAGCRGGELLVAELATEVEQAPDRPAVVAEGLAKALVPWLCSFLAVGWGGRAAGGLLLAGGGVAAGRGPGPAGAPTRGAASPGVSTIAGSWGRPSIE